MKKSVVVAFAFFMIFTLVGCGGSKYEGNWKATDVKSAAEIHMDPRLTGSSLELVLSSEGKGKMILNGASVDIKWSETEKGVKIDQEGRATVELILEEGKLTMKDQNQNTIYFEKQ